ncbi:unnamed protein product [Sympodiomycopsis kandeliae]
MTRTSRSNSPSGTFGRRSASQQFQVPAFESLDGPVSERLHGKQRRIDGSSEQNSLSAKSGSSSSSNLKDSSTNESLHPSSSGLHGAEDSSHSQPQSNPSWSSRHSRTRHKDKNNNASDESYEPQLPNRTLDKGCGRGERGAADTIRPLRRTISPDSIAAQQRQQDVRAKLRDELKEVNAQADYALMYRSLSQNERGSLGPEWEIVTRQEDTDISPDHWLYQVVSARRPSVSDATIRGAQSMTRNDTEHRQSLKFIAPREASKSNSPNSRPISRGYGGRLSPYDKRHSRTRSTPSSAFRNSRGSDPRRSMSPGSESRIRHHSFHALGTPSRPLSFPIGTQTSHRERSTTSSQLIAEANDVSRSRPWRASAATHFHDDSEAKEFIARQRKVSDAYSAAAAALEPRLPKQAAGSSHADPFIPHAPYQNALAAVERASAPLRLVLPLLATFFFDFNALFIISQLAQYGDDSSVSRAATAWWVAFAVYIASTLCHLVLFATLLARAYVRQTNLSGVLAVPTYLSFYGRLLLLMRKSSLHHFVRVIDGKATKAQRAIESAWRVRQAWPMVAAQIPRLVIAIVYLIVYNSRGGNRPSPQSQRDPFFFDTDSGALSTYSFAITLANISWIGFNVLLVSAAALYVALRRRSQISRSDADSDQMASNVPAQPHAWQQDTRDRICLALLELENVTTLDHMDRVPVHSTHGRISQLGRGASLSGTVLGSPGEQLPPMHGVGGSWELLPTGFDFVQASDNRGEGAVAGPGFEQQADPALHFSHPPQPAHSLLPTSDSVPFPLVQAMRTSSEGPSRSYIAQAAALEAGDIGPSSNRAAEFGRRSPTNGPLERIRASLSSSEQTETGPATLRGESPANIVSSDQRVEDPVLQSSSDSNNLPQKQHSPTLPSLIASYRTSKSTRKLNRNGVEGPASAKPIESSSASTPRREGDAKDDSSNRFWAGWFGSQGRRLSGSLSKSYAANLASEDKGRHESGGPSETVDANDGNTIDASGARQTVIGFDPSSHRPEAVAAADDPRGTAADTASLDENALVEQPRDESEATSSSGASGTGTTQTDSEDSEEHRIWQMFPEQTLRHPPGLIALELQERAREERERAMETGVALSTDNPDDDNVQQGGHPSDMFGRSPSEGGLMAIREESSSLGHSAASDRPGSRGQSVSSGGARSGVGRVVSGGSSAGSGLAAAREDEQETKHGDERS